VGLCAEVGIEYKLVRRPLLLLVKIFCYYWSPDQQSLKVRNDVSQKYVVAGRLTRNVVRKAKKPDR
jgi:hypothetical protein